MDYQRRALPRLVAVAAVVPLLLAGCTGGPVARSGAQSSPLPPPTLAITPTPESRDLPISTEIGLNVTGGKVTDVVVAEDGGDRIDGALRDDGSSWVPSAPLAANRSYTAEVTAKNDQGEAVVQRTKFTTMDKPASRLTSNLYLQNDRTYGTAMPVVLGFATPVAKEARAEVQRRLFVQTDPAQPGVWHWSDDGRSVSYRAPDLWKKGTKIAIRAALAGVPMGGGRYGDTDRIATATIGDDVRLDIDNATKQMSVYKNDELLRKIPVSLGKSRTPTSSGNMVIMEKHVSTVFDTRGDPDGGYVVTVANAQRLTWGGEFIHAAPWSVADQGRVNVSHGCTNVSEEAAEWLMGVTQVGDLVTVRGTEVKLERGNGWTVWDMPWEEYVKGSALPVPADLKPTEPEPPTGAPESAGPANPSGAAGG
jgi:lipoprotein-anchoring transpeptidase ErfK/SrfK